MRSYVYVSLLVCCIISAVCFGNPWREYVEDQKLHQRGPKKEITKEYCEDQRLKRLNTNCLQKVHIDYLRENRACPLCDTENMPSGVFFEGCFAAGTKIWVENKVTGLLEWLPIEFLVGNIKQYSLITLSLDSTLSNLRYDKIDILRSVQGPETELLVVIITESGQTLKVTEEHAVLLATGELVTASAITEGDQLVDVSGTPTNVLSVTREAAIGDVYNLFTAGDTSLSHMIISDGLLTGDLKLQGITEKLVLLAYAEKF